jgi:hypothetical protein
MSWLQLVVSLPTSPSAVRVRTWRALKASGCGALRDGVYLLPDVPDCARVFAELADSVRRAGGDAHVIAFGAADAAQHARFLQLFDRAADYKAFGAELARARRALRADAAASGRRTLRALEQRLDGLRRIDFFADGRADEMAAALERLRVESEARWSPGEPIGSALGTIKRLDPAAYQRRVWATRRRPWVDRLASAWLIRRYVDRQARFVWLAPRAKASKNAVGFDFDGAAFTHAAGKVTFEVIAASFGLDGDEALRRIGEAVHYIDVGGAASEEAAGLEAMMRGLQARHDDDDELLDAALGVFDALYAGMKRSA